MLLYICLLLTLRKEVKLIDYLTKSKIIKEDFILKLSRRASLYNYLIDYNKEDTITDTLKHDFNMFNLCWDNFIHDKEAFIEFLKSENCDLDMSFYEYLKECEKINHATYERNKRLKDKINKMLLSGHCIFLTLTFNNDILDSTNELTRRKYVSRYLKDLSNKYIANIDFGLKTEREHYHAIIRYDDYVYINKTKTDSYILMTEKWPYGFINAKDIQFNNEIENDNTNTKLAKYINKLTNHAIKETTKRNHLIFSKNC